MPGVVSVGGEARGRGSWVATGPTSRQENKGQEYVGQGRGLVPQDSLPEECGCGGEPQRRQISHRSHTEFSISALQASDSRPTLSPHLRFQ